LTSILDRRSLAGEIERLGPWFHNLHLPGGVQTAPDHYFGDFPAFKWRQIANALPDDLRGRRVLDIGCNAGFYSFALAERGADVLGIDADPQFLRQARWAAEVMGLPRVRFERCSVYDIDKLSGRFDIVVFMGVFYHLRYPLLALDLIAERRPDLLLFQSLTFGEGGTDPGPREALDFSTRRRLGDPDWPHLAFVEGVFNNDPTNWWVPNAPAAEAMLRAAGFAVTARPAPETYLCEPVNRWKQGGVEEPPDVPAAAALARRLHP